MHDELIIRTARKEDLPAIIRMLADDALGSTRELVTKPLLSSYYAAFDAIAVDPHNHLIVAEFAHAVVGTLQLTFTPSLSYQGRPRATVESVRADATLRGQGIGTALMQYAIDLAREHGCVLMQLSTHKTRVDAHRFYERLGFTAGHVGMKLMLDS
jgi:GNAT superfamily N-acetyltransferase